jgi:ferritin-like metal-binding protein YciE
MAAPNARDTKLIQYLNEAYGKERELETALEAHIAMTTRPPYKQRLREHLKETKGHARQLKTRIRELGGKAEAGPISAGPTAVVEAASTLTSVAGKAVAAAQGPLHAIRGTGESERMLKNAKSEYHNEAEEIAAYTGIEALADAVNDKETVKLARGIRREEERMAKFLEKQIPQLAKAVAREEIPAAERRNGASSSRRSSSSRSRSTANGVSRSSSASRSSGSRASSARASSARASSSPPRKGSGSARSASARSGSSSRGKASRSGSARSASARSGSSSRGKASRSGSARSGSSRSASSRLGSARSASSRSGSSPRSRSK